MNELTTTTQLPAIDRLKEPLQLSGPDAKVDRDGVWDLTMAQYHSDICSGPSISSSGLRKVWSSSPAHYHYTSPYNPFPPVPDERPHFSLGRATHHLLFLGRKGFDTEFIVRPDKWKDWRSDAAKSWRQEQWNAGLTIVTEGELEKIIGMARALAAHPLVKAGILNGYVERSLIYRDPVTGMWVKSRPDNIPNNSGDYSDLKTTQSVETESLLRTLANFGYPMQAGVTALASNAVLNRDLLTFSLVFVETDPPHCVRCIQIKPSDLDRAIRQIQVTLEIVAECHATGRWPGPGGDTSDAEFLELPVWASKRIDDQLAIIDMTRNGRI